MAKDWKRETARDIVALGSMTFYLIVIVRAIIGRDNVFVYQLVVALLVLWVLSQLIKKTNKHIARGLVLTVFISFFYQEILFSIFAALFWLLMILSLNYVKVEGNAIGKGIVVGVISTGVGYAATFLI